MESSNQMSAETSSAVETKKYVLCLACGYEFSPVCVICRIDRLEKKVDSQGGMLIKAAAIIDKVASEVTPVLDQLMESPLLKMLGVNSKKDVKRR